MLHGVTFSAPVPQSMGTYSREEGMLGDEEPQLYAQETRDEEASWERMVGSLYDRPRFPPDEEEEEEEPAVAAGLATVARVIGTAAGTAAAVVEGAATATASWMKAAPAMLGEADALVEEELAGGEGSEI